MIGKYALRSLTIESEESVRCCPTTSTYAVSVESVKLGDLMREHFFGWFSLPHQADGCVKAVIIRAA